MDIFIDNEHTLVKHAVHPPAMFSRRYARAFAGIYELGCFKMSLETEFKFISENKKNNIYTREWLPDCPPRGILQIAHGISEHMGRYNEFARFVSDKLGFVVVGNDYLGHGRTLAEGDIQGYFDHEHGWNTVTADLHNVYKIESRKYPELPYFLMGHSMGSFLVQTYMINYDCTGLGGIILSATGQPPRRLLRGALSLVRSEKRILGPSYRTHKAVNRKHNGKAPHAGMFSGWITSDKAKAEEYFSDPLRVPSPTFGLLEDMFGGMLYVSDKNNIKKIPKDLPIYFFSGNRDPVGEYGKGVFRIYERFLDSGCTDLYLKIYKGRHEMLNELCRDAVCTDVCKWIDGQMRWHPDSAGITADTLI